MKTVDVLQRSTIRNLNTLSPRRTQKNNSRKAYLPQAGRQGAKDFSLRLCVLARKQRKKSRKAGKPLRVLDPSLRLCVFARKEKNRLRRRAFKKINSRQAFGS
jgi:hypothetical protein